MAPRIDDDHLRGQEKPNPCSSSDLTVPTELSDLLQRTSELASRPAPVQQEQQNQQQPKGNKARPNSGNKAKSDSGNNNKVRRPSSAGGNSSRGGSASHLRLRRAPSHCPSCSGAPFTDATFLQDDDGQREEREGDEGGEVAKRDLAGEARLWVLENGRAVSAPLLALLVVAASVTWSLYEYAGSSAAALAGPALYAAKACVATSQACYG